MGFLHFLSPNSLIAWPVQGSSEAANNLILILRKAVISVHALLTVYRARTGVASGAKAEQS